MLYKYDNQLYMKFGTDGIRGIVGSEEINCDHFLQIGKKFANYIKGKTIIVSHDTRRSSIALAMSFISGILTYCNVIHTYLPIGALSRIIENDNNIDGGAMITASHNTYEYNGIKFFNSQGEKIHFQYDGEYEVNYGKYIFKEYKDIYNQDIIHTLSKVKIDCGNGAMSYLSLYNKCNDQYNGYNINIYPEIDVNCEYYARIDGDGDRLSLYRYGIEIKTDDIIATLGQDCTIIVGTSMTSLALRRFCIEKNIKFYESNVGDMNIYKYISDIKKYKTSNIIGGESSGHIILNKISDSIINLYKYIIHDNKISLKYDYALEYNIDNYTLNQDLISKIIYKYKNKNNNIVIRNSGTENKLRIKVETESIEQSQMILENIINLLSVY